jgi:sugar phosphate isomerase/epimerase
MKLAISNIAWNPDEDEAVSRLMQQYNVTGVEIAPTKIWSKPLDASNDDIAGYTKRWLSRGIRISSMQALLFGRPDLTIFESPDKRDETLKYLEGIIRLGGQLGAEALVFGSPGNRRIGDLDRARAEEIAVEFFRSVGKTAEKHNTVFCIEPNPITYGCDFVTTSAEGRDLVAKVDQRGFGLHLDAAGMTLSQEDVEPELAKSIAGLCHFHISEPNLKPIGTGGVDHALFSRCLSTGVYDRWFSIEMRAPGGVENITGVENAFRVVRKFYR